MDITFLIGNGFDLGLGLETKYSDYYKIYCNKEKSDLANNIKGDIENWSDFEECLGKYTNRYTRKTKKEFFDEIENFEEGFVDYLDLEEQRIDYDPKIIVPTFEKAILHFYESDILTPNDSQKIQWILTAFASKNCVFNFINFNYTDTFDKCLDIFSTGIADGRKHKMHNSDWKIGGYVHVHGEKRNYPIIGVDNINQIKNEELANDSNFVQRFVKPQMNNYIGMQFSEDARRFIKNSRIICVYGLSIGTTDATWWNMLAEWLKGNKNNRLILFIYDSNYRNTISSRAIETKYEIKHSFLNYSKYNNNIQHDLSKQVYVAINENIFGMNLTR